MNDLNLYFNLSGTDFDTNDLRQEMSTALDEILKRTGQGHWIGSSIKGNILQIKCKVHNPDLARAQISQLLSDHWIIQHLLPE